MLNPWPAVESRWLFRGRRAYTGGWNRISGFSGACRFACNSRDLLIYLVAGVDAAIIPGQRQATEALCGVIARRVYTTLHATGTLKPGVQIIADTDTRIRGEAASALPSRRPRRQHHVRGRDQRRRAVSDAEA